VLIRRGAQALTYEQVQLLGSTKGLHLLLIAFSTLPILNPAPIFHPARTAADSGGLQTASLLQLVRGWPGLHSRA